MTWTRKFHNIVSLLVVCLPVTKAYAQKPPNITYVKPQTFAAGKAITPLTPVNTGGAVPVSQFGQSSLFASGFQNPGSIAVDASGNFYIADHGTNSIDKVTPAGVITTFVSGYTTAYQIAASANGNVYFTDFTNGLILKASPQGVVSTLAGSGPVPSNGQSADGKGTLASFIRPKGLAVDVNGTVYVSEGDNKIRKVDPTGLVSTIAGTGYPGFGNGSGLAATFSDPSALAIDNVGNLYVTDVGNNCVRKITPTGAVTTFAGFGDQGSNDGAGTFASFRQLTGISIDENNNLYVSDLNSLRKITVTGFVNTLFSNVSDFSNATIAYYNNNVYFTSVSDKSVRKVNIIGNYTIDGLLPDGLTFDRNTGTISGTPTQIVTEQAYIVTASNSFGTSAATLNITIAPPSPQKIVQAPKISYTSPHNFGINTAIQPLAPVNIGGMVPGNIYGEVSVIAGSSPSNAIIDGVGTAARFAYPYRLSVDTSGNVYVTDNTLLRRITPTGVVTTLGLNGQFVTSPSASMAVPVGDLVTIDNTGNIYISEPGTTAIRKITPAGVVSNFAGNRSTTYKDGVGNNASFSILRSMVTDKFGNLFVADAHTIRKITPNSVVTTFAGNPQVSVNADGQGTNASFSSPNIINIDTAGNLFVLSGGLIKKVTSQALVTTISSYIPNLTYLAGVTGDISGNFYFGINTTSPSIPASIIKTTQGNNTSSVTVTNTLTALLGGMTIDRRGNLYVAESNTARIKRVNITGYTIEPSLPTGLVFDNKTGVISGTPTTAVASKVYTITAYNAGGSSSYPLTIAVATATTTITGISPSTTASGGIILIKGYHFTGASVVSFGAVPAKSFTVNSDTTLTATIGSGATGTVLVTTPNGTGTFAGFTFVPVPVISTNGSTTFFTGGSVLLSAKPASVGYTYQWNKDNTPISGANAATYTATESGSYTATITTNSVSQTSAAMVINVVFTLPQNNFQLTATSATCKGTADGAINITATENLNYIATITGSGINSTYPFSSKLAINSLAKGTYHVCITVQNQPGYQQCYDLFIAEPQDLSVYTTINKSENTVTLSFNGGNQYNILLNGATYTSSENSITLPLISMGNNTLQVTTDKLCQGLFEKLINISGNYSPYPNPFQNTLSLNIGSNDVEHVMVKIYDVSDGKVFYSKEYVNQSGVLLLDVTGLNNGVYALHLILDNTEKVFKIFKQ